MASSVDLKKIVVEKLNVPSKCYGHCEERSTLKFLPEERMMVGCYSCPSGYVSRIVAYGRELHVGWFKSLIAALLKGFGDVADEDIRVATRYTWDLGVEGKPDGTVLKQAYWTQNYRRTKSEDLNRQALFLCTRCSGFYHQPAAGTHTICSRCRTPTA